MAAQTLISNQTISSLVTSPVLTANGALANAQMDFTLSVPFGNLIEFAIDSSSDNGVTWSGKDGYRIDNRGGTKTETFRRTSVIPNQKGLKLRARVTEIAGAATVTSVTLTN